MKLNFKYKTLITIVIAGCIALTGFAIGNHVTTADGGLVLALKPSNSEYRLGEIVNITLELSDQSGENIVIPNNFNVGSGFLTVLISHDGKNYENYGHPGWGLIDSEVAGTEIKTGKNVSTTATLLWKWKGDEKSEFLFSNVGMYYLKAQYTIPAVKQEDFRQIESPVVEITITMPAGDDLKAWNLMKNNGDYASFLQSDDIGIPSYKTEERAAFIRSVEQIIVKYPESFYAEKLRHSLDAFRTREAKINERKKRPQ